MFLIIMTFLLTTAFYAFLLWLACRRVSRHLQGNADGVKAVTDHVLIPLLGAQPEDESGPCPASEPDAGIAPTVQAQK
jgi:hypothetical protein